MDASSDGRGSLSPFRVGSVVGVTVWRWQWEDGLTAEPGHDVSWDLALVQRTDVPELALTVAGTAAPTPCLTRDPRRPHCVDLRSGPLAASLDAASPLTGDVVVSGVLTADWYGRTAPAVPPTRGHLSRFRLVEATVSAHTGLPAAPGSVRLLPLDGSPGIAWPQPELGPRAAIGVLVDLVLTGPP